MGKERRSQAFYPHRRLLQSLTLDPKTIDIASPPPPPQKEIPGRKPVCHEIMLQKYLMFVWENSAPLNRGEEDLLRFLVGTCPDRTKEQTHNLGKMFHWKPPKTYENDMILICVDIMHKFNMLLSSRAKCPTFFILPITMAKFSWFYLLSEGHMYTWPPTGVAPPPSEGVEEKSPGVLRIIMMGYRPTFGSSPVEMYTDTKFVLGWFNSIQF